MVLVCCWYGIVVVVVCHGIVWYWCSISMVSVWYLHGIGIVLLCCTGVAMQLVWYRYGDSMVLVSDWRGIGMLLVRNWHGVGTVAVWYW